MGSADFGWHLGVVRTGGLQLRDPHSDAPALCSPNYFAEI
jgi:hypothetical protein